MSSDLTRYDAVLPAEVEAYIKQHVIPVPEDYVDEWHAEFGKYDPIRDEAFAYMGILPRLTFDDWIRDHPAEPYPIIMRIDRGFPARYMPELEKANLDTDLLRRLGLDDNWIRELEDNLQYAQWFPIADCLTPEDDKFRTKDLQIGGHPVPSHGCMVGFRADWTWQAETHGPERDVKRFN